MPSADLSLQFIAHGEKLAIAWCKGFDNIRKGCPKSTCVYARARQYLVLEECVNLWIDLKSRAFDTC